MKRVFLLCCAVLLFALTGCSTFCAGTFGPVGAACIPYKTYEIGRDINDKTQPGGLYNPQGVPSSPAAPEASNAGAANNGVFTTSPETAATAEAQNQKVQSIFSSKPRGEVDGQNQ